MATVTIKATHRLINLGKIVDVGDTLELDAENAEQLVEEGFAEIEGAVKRAARRVAHVSDE